MNSNSHHTGPVAPFKWPVRVYWEDTDAGGVVYYANYLRFFERARTEWLRHRGIEQRQLQLEANVIFIVAHVELQYLAPARLDDLLTVTTEVIEERSASLRLRQQVIRDGALIVEGTVRVGCVDPIHMKPRRIPDSVRVSIGPQG